MNDRPSRAPSVIVTGSGRVSGVPDMLRLDMAVQVTRPEVSAALSGSNVAARAVLDALRAHGVAAPDLQTSGLSVQPDYDYSGSAPVVRGYQASEQVSARLRDLAAAGDALSAAVAAAGDAARVNGAWLEISDDGALLSEARDAAFADARAKAEQYARAAGRELGDVRRIIEGSMGRFPPHPRVGPLVASAAAEVPVEPGSSDVATAVTVVWELR